MAALNASFSGRKRESCAWDYFEYRNDIDKSVCKVRSFGSRSECGKLLSGKNTSNLVAHLRRRHQLQYEMFMTAEKRKQDKRNSKTKSMEGLQSNNVVLDLGESTKKRTAIQSLLDFIVSSGSQITLVDSLAFRDFIRALNSDFELPDSNCLEVLMHQEFLSRHQIVKMKISESRKISLCIDTWKRPGLHSSFVGISACFYDQFKDTPQHVLLKFKNIPHPYTGIKLFNMLEECLFEWNISQTKILHIISGSCSSKMVKNIKIKQELMDIDDGKSDGDDNNDCNDDDCDEDEDCDPDNLHIQELNYGIEPTEADIENHLTLNSLPSLAHKIQLLIKPLYKHYESVLIKMKKIASHIFKSDIAMEQLLAKWGKSVISCCISNPKDTFEAVKNFLLIKSDIRSVSADVNLLLPHEWVQLEEFVRILMPFVEQVHTLRSETVSLSSFLATILNLECHLKMSEGPKMLMHQVWQTLKSSFAVILDTQSPMFNCLPSVACLLDPSLREVVFKSESSELLQAATSYIVKVNSAKVFPFALSENGVNGMEPPLKKFWYLSRSLNCNLMHDSTEDLQCELNQYLSEIVDESEDALMFWKRKKSSYPLLSNVAEDILSARASHTYMNDFLSFCQIMIDCHGIACSSLEMRAFININRDIL